MCIHIHKVGLKIGLADKLTTDTEIYLIGDPCQWSLMSLITVVEALKRSTISNTSIAGIASNTGVALSEGITETPDIAVVANT